MDGRLLSRQICRTPKQCNKTVREPRWPKPTFAQDQRGSVSEPRSSPHRHHVLSSTTLSLSMYSAENGLLREPLDGAGNRISGDVSAEAISAPAMRFPPAVSGRAARKVRVRSPFPADYLLSKVTK